MTAARFTTKVVRNTHTYLAQMPKNYVFNKLDLLVGGDIHQVRGFIGVRNSTSEPLEGAFCWGSGANLQSIIFSITQNERTTTIQLPQVPRGMAIATVENAVKSLILALKGQIQEKFLVIVEGRERRGGKYTGPRLEAHRRIKTLPANKFAQARDKFTPEFAALAPRLNVTYR
jgi:hypothetical protein